MNLWVEGLNDIIQHLGSDLIATVAGTLTPGELISSFEDLKWSKPADKYKKRQLEVLDLSENVWFINKYTTNKHALYKINQVKK